MTEETAEINEILGKLEQEILNLRNSEAVKVIKPFTEDTDKLVKRIESVDFPKRLDEIKSKTNELEKLYIDTSKKITDDVRNSMNEKFIENARSIKINKIISITTLILVLIAITLIFIKL